MLDATNGNPNKREIDKATAFIMALEGSKEVSSVYKDMRAKVYGWFRERRAPGARLEK